MHGRNYDQLSNLSSCRLVQPVHTDRSPVELPDLAALGRWLHHTIRLQ